MRLLSAIAVIGICCFPVLAEDLNPPEWRGEEGSTLQIWEFFSADNPAAPDVDQNPYGSAVAEVTGDFPFTQWLSVDPVDTTAEGVWRFEDYMRLDIPNQPIDNPYKLIRIQLTLSTGDDADMPADIAIMADGTEVPADQISFLGMTQLSEYYYHATYDIVIYPNPTEESIYIQPRDCTLYVDEVVVDTICVPEPASLLLLSLVGLLVRRR